MSTIDQYREAKSNYLKLRTQAKKELIARFNELSGELLRLQRELLEDFGEKIAIPSKSKKARAAKPSAQPAQQPIEQHVPSPKVIAIRKQLEKHKKKLSDTQAAGKPTKVIEDRIYELEDELRLAQLK